MKELCTATAVATSTLKSTTVELKVAYKGLAVLTVTAHNRSAIEELARILGAPIRQIMSEVDADFIKEYGEPHTRSDHWLEEASESTFTANKTWSMDFIYVLDLFEDQDRPTSFVVQLLLPAEFKVFLA